MADMKLAVMGAGGRMGQALTRAIHDIPGCVIAGGSEQPGSPFVGRDVAEVAGLEPCGALITDDVLQMFTEVEGVLDFTVPVATVGFAKYAAQARIPHIIGTTGFDQKQDDELMAASRHCPMVKAGNMSLGVNLLTALTQKVSKILDSSFDIEIVEMHHKHKVDAPSGTALMLGEAAAKGRAVDLDETAVRSRDGQIGARKEGDIGFATLRGGSVVGDHSVIFAGEGERIVLTHKAEDRQIFARGAVKAALWARNKAPGLYSMIDVLDL